MLYAPPPPIINGGGIKTGVSLITAGYRRLPQDTAGSPDIGVFNGIYHTITWNRYYIMNNLHRAVIDAYETLCGTYEFC